MSDDYLWDKSGEPDPEIEELEELLGELRYHRPREPLPLPKRAPVNQRRIFNPVLAAAAGLLFVLMAAGLWLSLGVRSQGESSVLSAANEQLMRAAAVVVPDSKGLALPEQVKVNPDGPGGIIPVATGAPRSRGPRRSPVFNRRELSGGRMARSSPPNRDEQISEVEGVAAREQLIKALHLASSKLNLVQKKIQDSKSPGPIS